MTAAVQNQLFCRLASGDVHGAAQAHGPDASRADIRSARAYCQIRTRTRPRVSPSVPRRERLPRTYATCHKWQIFRFFIIPQIEKKYHRKMMKNLLNFVRIFRELLENHMHLSWGRALPQSPAVTAPSEREPFGWGHLRIRQQSTSTVRGIRRFPKGERKALLRRAAARNPCPPKAKKCCCRNLPQQHFLFQIIPHTAGTPP